MFIYSKYNEFGAETKTIKSKVKPYNCQYVMYCDTYRYQNVSTDLKRGTSLRYPLKEKERVVQNLTANASPIATTSNQLNGLTYKKPLAESVSAATIQSEKEVDINDRPQYPPTVANGHTESLSLRRQVLARVISPGDVAGSQQVTRAGSLGDVSRTSSGHRLSANRSLSLPIKDDIEKSVKMSPSTDLKAISKIDKDDEYSQLRDTPALQFLTRKDLYKYMTNAGVRFIIIFQIICNG